MDCTIGRTTNGKRLPSRLKNPNKKGAREEKSTTSRRQLPSRLNKSIKKKRARGEQLAAEKEEANKKARKEEEDETVERRGGEIEQAEQWAGLDLLQKAIEISGNNRDVGGGGGDGDDDDEDCFSDDDRDVDDILPISLYQNRISRYRKMGMFHSRKQTTKATKKTIKSHLYKVCKYVYDKGLGETSKQPTGCPTRPSPVNFYITTNKKRGKDKPRRVLAEGEGRYTTGLNPKTNEFGAMFSNEFGSMFPEALDLLDLVTKEINRNERWKEQMQGHSFNTISGEIYYSYKKRRKGGKVETVRKKIGYHTDFSTNGKIFTHSKFKTGKATGQHLQKEGTPVAMLVYGDNKNLWFQRSKLAKKDIIEASELRFIQTSGDLYVLDPEDQVRDKDGYFWYHKSDMIDDDSITFSLMFRVTEGGRGVDTDGKTRTGANQPPLTANQNRNNKEAEAIYNTQEYAEQLSDFRSKMEDFFTRHKV